MYLFFVSLNCYSKPIDLHKGSLQLSKTTFCCSTLSINWTVLTSNSPGDWGSVIEIKILQAKKKKKVGLGDFGGAIGPPRSISGKKPKNKLSCWVKNLRICPGERSQRSSPCPRTVVENQHEPGWAETRSCAVLETVEIMTVFGNKIIVGVRCQPTFSSLFSCFPPKQGIIGKRLFLPNKESDASSLSLSVSLTKVMWKLKAAT